MWLPDVAVYAHPPDAPAAAAAAAATAAAPPPLLGRGVLVPGDLWVNCFPNCGNPQKAQRYPLEWADALERMAAMGAAALLPGHGPMLLGVAAVRDALTAAAAALRRICDRVLTLINENLPLNAIVATIRREGLAGRTGEADEAPRPPCPPFLRPVYDDPVFVVSGLYRRYAGWWSGFVPDIHPAPHEDLGHALLAVTAHASGRVLEGAAALQQFVLRIRAVLLGAADPAVADDDAAAAAPVAACRLALHFVELVFLHAVRRSGGSSHAPVAAPAAAAVRRVEALRAALLRRLAAAESSLMGRRVYSRAVVLGAAAADEMTRAASKL